MIKNRRKESVKIEDHGFWVKFGWLARISKQVNKSIDRKESG